MSKLNFVRRCHNCGAILQDERPEDVGYVLPETLANTSARVLFCNKCFDESRYNFAPRTPKVSPDFLTMLADAEASDALIVYVVDLFSFENSFIPEVNSLVEGLPLIVVANKRDLLPEEVPDEDLREYVAHRFRVAGLSLTRDDVYLASLTSSAEVSHISKAINEKRRRHDVYFIGAEGAGKTLLITSFLRNYKNSSNRVVQTGNYPGTSLAVMQIPLDSSSYAYDTPGTSLDNSLLSHLDPKSRRAVMPTVEVKQRTESLTEGESIMIGGLARIELLKGEKTHIREFFSKKVELHKAKSKGEAVFFKKLAAGDLLPACPSISAPADFDAYDIGVEESGDRDIGIAGLGWISFIGEGQTFRVYVPKGVSIYSTRSKIKSKK